MCRIISFLCSVYWTMVRRPLLFLPWYYLFFDLRFLITRFIIFQQCW